MSIFGFSPGLFWGLNDAVPTLSFHPSSQLSTALTLLPGSQFPDGERWFSAALARALPLAGKPKGDESGNCPSSAHIPDGLLESLLELSAYFLGHSLPEGALFLITHRGHGSKGSS